MLLHVRFSRRRRWASVGASALWNSSVSRAPFPSTASTSKSCDSKKIEQKGYQSIGSFHSESVEVLTTLPDELYTAPELPFEFECPATTRQKNMQFPTPSLRHAENYGDEDFMIDTNKWTFVNHGAFGGALHCGHLRANSWRAHLERQPLRYFDRDLLPHLALANRRVAAFCKAELGTLTLIQNATVGCNAVIGGYTRQFKAESMILYFDVSYGSVKSMSRHYANQVGGSVVEIPFQDVHLPFQTATSAAEATAIFVQVLDAAIHDIQHKKRGGTVKNALFVLDHTTSNTAINVPIEALARRAKEHDMLVLVDGAHGVLAQDLDLTSLARADGVDFYVGNCHKWLAAPRGAALLYCQQEELRNGILRVPAVIANGVDDGYHSRFLWDGSRDYAAQLCLPVVLDYWNRLGTDNVRREMRQTMSRAVQILADLWHSSFLASFSNEDDNQQEITLSTAGITIAPWSMHSPMALVRLPANINNVRKSSGSSRISADAKAVQDFLYNNFVECPIKCIGGILYARISCHVYNKPEDYERLGRVVLQFPGFG
jgi:selenocysteine lyase/cysteine desulfurase